MTAGAGESLLGVNLNLSTSTFQGAISAMEEVERIKPLQKVQGLIAYVCPSCRYTTSEILPARGSGCEE